MLITRLLNKVLEEVQQIKKPYYAQVERACIAALQDIRSVDTDGESEHKILRQKSLEYEETKDAHDPSANLDLLVGEEARPQISVDSEKFFVPFELACKGEAMKITITALDAIQKLVAYGELVGDYPDPKAPTRRLIDRIVETICSCHVETEGHEGVELQIIKALLTIVTSEQVQIHDSTLLLILRTVCILHLTTKSPVNKRTARAMLTQMLHSIFHRMEIAIEELDIQPKKGKDSRSSDSFGFSEDDWEMEFMSLIQNYFSHSLLSVSPEFLNSSFSPSPRNMNHAENQESFANFENANFDPEPEAEKDINQNSKNLSDSTTVASSINSNDQIESNEKQSQFKSNNDEGDATNPFLVETPPSRKAVSDSSSPGNGLVNLLQKDAFLSFWTLTKLALKPLSKPDSDNETTDKAVLEIKFQQAILAFHLLKEILEKSGKVFKESPIFSNAMKQHLVYAMTKNGISNNAEVFSLEVQILMILLQKFSESLNSEIQNLLDVIVFPVLEAPSSHPAEYFKIILRSLKDISNNLECFIHLFCSYDQDIDSHTKPFRKIVNSLNKIICGKMGHEQIAVEIIANLLKSMSRSCPKLDDSSDPAAEPEKLRRFSSFEEPLKFDDDGIQNLELEGKDFLTCLHIFLAHIEVPSDVFKIDWSVQKLAQRLTDTSSVNSYRTETADCWYALIYASMSLIADIRITDCQGKSKMSKNQFLKLNKAVNGCEPLDDVCLSFIYDEIEENYRREGSDDETKRGQPNKWLPSLGKSEQEILDVLKYILESTSLLRSHFSLGKQLKHVKRMIKICGTSFLLALISALQNTNDTKLTDVCLDGIHSGIRVACILGLDNERETFVQALAKLSIQALDEIQRKHINKKIVTTTTSTQTMTTENGVTKTVVTTTTEMKCRSVDIILTLLDVGIAEGNHLGGSWLHILKFISQLLSTSLLAESRNPSRSGSPVPPPPSSASTAGGNIGSSLAAWAGSLKESLEKKLWDPASTSLHPSVKESIANSVEKVFKRSEMLTGDAMTDFFQALCQVSLHDMMNSETPRHLMYEKINEVADGNFYRPALQWSQIWQVVADYFCHLACSSKEEISALAIDSIQKLVLKLLKKETLNGYRFQNHYFSPFKVIITNTRSEVTRESILGFIETVISLHSDLLLSGWIAILEILVVNMVSHNENKDAASADSFRVLQHIVDKCQKDEVNLRNSYGSIVKSLIDIAANIAPTLEMSEQAFRLLTQMAEIPYRHPQLLMEENDDKMYRVWARGWKPILNELSAVICSPNQDTDDSVKTEVGSNNQVLISGNMSPSWDIKTKALITLFEVIKSYGSAFEKEWWNSVFETLFYIFSHIKSHEKQDLMLRATQLLRASTAPSSSVPPASTSPSSTTSDGSYKYFYCYYYVQFAIFDVYIQFYDATTAYVFDELLRHLQWCICQDHEQIALSGVSCLQQLVIALGKRFSAERWDSILSLFQTMCQPSTLLARNGEEENVQDISTAAFNLSDNLECQSVAKTEIIQTPAIRAVVYLELLKIMDRVVFPSGRCSPNGSSDDLNDEYNLPTRPAFLGGSDEVNPMLSDAQLSIIMEILNKAHENAKEHCIVANSHQNEDPENGSFISPNFIPHETLSLQIYWKILFALLKTDDAQQTKHRRTDKESLWAMIQQSCIRSCGYFVTIRLKEHRDAWADLLCFSMSNIMSLPRPNFEKMTSQLYPYFCDMMEVDLLDSRICDKLREYLLLVGKDYGVFKPREQRRSEQISGGEDDAHSLVHSMPKTCNNINGAQYSNPFQGTCISDALNENYMNESKDFQ